MMRNNNNWFKLLRRLRFGVAMIICTPTQPNNYEKLLLIPPQIYESIRANLWRGWKGIQTFQSQWNSNKINTFHPLFIWKSEKSCILRALENLRLHTSPTPSYPPTKHHKLAPLYDSAENACNIFWKLLCFTPLFYKLSPLTMYINAVIYAIGNLLELTAGILLHRNILLSPGGRFLL